MIRLSFYLCSKKYNRRSSHAYTEHSHLYKGRLSVREHYRYPIRNQRQDSCKSSPLPSCDADCCHVLDQRDPNLVSVAESSIRPANRPDHLAVHLACRRLEKANAIVPTVARLAQAVSSIDQIPHLTRAPSITHSCHPGSNSGDNQSRLSYIDDCGCEKSLFMI